MKNDLVKKQELLYNLNIMSKNILRNSQYLEKLGRRAKGEATPKVGKILELYNLRKISQLQTAENAILKLISKEGTQDMVNLVFHIKMVKVFV